MGHTLTPARKPIFSRTPTQTVTDLQAAVDYAQLVGGVLKGTAAERGELTPGMAEVGWLFVETDTGSIYRNDATLGWVPLSTKPDLDDIVLSTGFEVTGGLSQHRPRIVRNGFETKLFAQLSTRTTAPLANFASILTVPPRHRPPNGGTRSVGSDTTNGGVSFELSMTNGVLQILAGWASASIPPGSAVPIRATWVHD